MDQQAGGCHDPRILRGLCRLYRQNHRVGADEAADPKRVQNPAVEPHAVE